MAELEFVAEIAASPERVAAFFVPQRMPYWYGREMQTEFEVQGGAADFAVGQKVRITGRLGRKEVSLTTVVTRFQPGRALEWRFADSYGVRGRQSWDLQESAKGTRVWMRDAYELPGAFGRLADRLLTRHAVARRDRAWLDCLKKIAENTGV